ncbi:MAG: patatin-like phospholipase family protein [Verrucomicrobia bacterium]|nr:patatin-like phospholipase family protein [Verrucomicrobiota bacterium]
MKLEPHLVNPQPAVADPTQPFRILALDGGGMRGYYTARLLARLQAHFETNRGSGPLDLGRGFDLIAGTSTGGILGCGIALGCRPEAIADLYFAEGSKIFRTRFPKLGLNLNLLAWVLKHWKKPTASAEALKAALEPVFGNVTLSKLWQERNVALVLPSISVESYGPKVFKTPHAPRFTHDRELKLVDVCLATGAAPLFFPLHPIGSKEHYNREDHFVDGGLWANNPALVGLIEAMEMQQTAGTRRPIQIFSFGTCGGIVDQSHLRANPEGGLQTWNFGKDVTELAVSSSAKGMDFMTRLLAKALSDTGWRVTYERIPDPEMTSDQQMALGLDKADPAAFEIMDRLAAANESRILSAIQSHNPAYAYLAELFYALPLHQATEDRKEDSVGA